MVTSSGEKSHPSARKLRNNLGAKEINKSPSCAKPSPTKTCDNVCASTKKISYQATENRSPIAHLKGKNQPYEAHQPNRTTSVSSSSHRASPRLKKDLVVRKPDESGDRNNPSTFKDSSWNYSSKVEDVLTWSLCSKEKEHLKRNSEEFLVEPGIHSSVCEGASANAMFLDFASVHIMKEDSDGDSASDLSDSERIPIPPSPCTPPDLNLRAEEIDPLYFKHLTDSQFQQPDYYYPDFLPPPYNTWDLKGLAVFVNTECKSEPECQPVGFLEKYIDRVLEMEWLQIQTIEAEKGKAARVRPQTAPNVLRTLKSPAKSKLLHSPLANKPLSPHEGFSKVTTGRPDPRRELYGERTSKSAPCNGQLKAAGAKSGSTAHQGRSGETRNDVKQRLTSKRQPDSHSPSDTSSMIQVAGNIRPPKHTSSFHSPAVPLKGLPAHTGGNLKMNENANGYLPSRKDSGDKKLRANGAKQTSCKFK